MRLSGLWWWIDRWRKSTAYMDMTLEQQGAYRNLLDEAHLRGGALPDDDRILAKACGDARAWKRLRPAVMARFKLEADGWHNPTLDAVIRESQRRADKQRSYRNRQGNSTGNESGNAVRPPLEPETDKSIQKQLGKEPPAHARENGNGSERVLADDDVKERAARFTERYAELFHQYRRGARYLGKPVLDYQEAITLCANWDSERLEKLAIAFLTTDEKFCRQGSGSIAQFRSRASWCDSRLREKGL